MINRGGGPGPRISPPPAGMAGSEAVDQSSSEALTTQLRVRNGLSICDTANSVTAVGVAARAPRASAPPPTGHHGDRAARPERVAQPRGDTLGLGRVRDGDRVAVLAVGRRVGRVVQPLCVALVEPRALARDARCEARVHLARVQRTAVAVCAMRGSEAI